MNLFLKVALLFLLIIGTTNYANAQKKTQKINKTFILDAPADQVWAVVGEDYGAIAKSHPKIMKSDYIGGSLTGGEGVERVCYFNEKGSRFLKEKQLNFDPENYTFKNKVFQAGKFPVDSDLTYAIYKVEAIDANTSRFTFDMSYRTKPAFMGAMMRNTFKKLISDYAIAIEHHVKTGVAVNKENFKAIKKESIRSAK